MKAMICELCGGNDIIKQDGFFVCQHCGTKYSTEEAKKLIVEVSGSVKLDYQDELKKLYIAARNAREVSDHVTALKYYELIGSKDPDSWEALFYTVVYKTISIKNGEIETAAYSIANCLKKVFSLIKENVSDPDKRKEAVREVFLEALSRAAILFDASYSFYKALTKGNGMLALTGIGGMATSIKSTGDALQGDLDRCAVAASIARICGDEIESQFGMTEEDYRKYAIVCWKQFFEFDSQFKKNHGSFLFKDGIKQTYAAKIREYEPSFTALMAEQNTGLPKAATSSGWGNFYKFGMIVFCLVPVSGALISCLGLNLAKQGATNVDTKIAKTTLIINIVVTVIAIIVAIASQLM